MINPFTYRNATTTVSAMAMAFCVLASCTQGETSTAKADLTNFATRYAAAWSSQSPDSLASFYAESGSLTVNDGTPSVGREAISATAQSFMAAFPDMLVVLDSVSDHGEQVVFHWTWTGTNTGPGGTGRPVRISGNEEWAFGPDGLILDSRGRYDDAEYERQVKPDSSV